ncbi:MAG: hypothetical protein Q8S15_05555 [Erysipelotrichaceae bacterium]|nr:hypothetical protein [Erysipelotrichaceae bacterium]
MKSIMGVSRALVELIKLMPEIAYAIQPNGETADVMMRYLKEGDIVLVEPDRLIISRNLMIKPGKADANGVPFNSHFFEELKRNHIKDLSKVVNLHKLFIMIW